MKGTIPESPKKDKEVMKRPSATSHAQALDITSLIKPNKPRDTSLSSYLEVQKRKLDQNETNSDDLQEKKTKVIPSD
jgi:hypothetical protein